VPPHRREVTDRESDRLVSAKHRFGERLSYQRKLIHEENESFGPGQGVSAAEPAGFSQPPKEQASFPQGAISATD
jgi:hypothetical protein